MNIDKETIKKITEFLIKRIDEEYEGNKENLSNHTKQDSIILNIQRACESCIDLAKNLKAMVGFRNIVVHNYQAINIDVIDRIINKHLDDMIKFKDIIICEFC